MVKITIILWMLTAIVYSVFKLLCYGLSSYEKYRIKYENKYIPTRMAVIMVILLLLSISFVISTIVTIVKW
jgi:hypothetical protein